MTRLSDAEIIEAVATKVMGWEIIDAPMSPSDWPKRPFTLRDVLGTLHRVDDIARIWNPLTDPAAAKQVREKLAERFKTSALCRNVDQSMTFSASKHGVATSYYAEADTEERAVCLAALKAHGVEL